MGVGMPNALPLVPTVIDESVSLVRRLVERARALLLCPREPNRLMPDADREHDSSATERNPSPEMWGAILIHARRHRTERQQRRLTPGSGIDPSAAILVPDYVMAPNGRARGLAWSAEEAR